MSSRFHVAIALLAVLALLGCGNGGRGDFEWLNPEGASDGQVPDGGGNPITVDEIRTYYEDQSEDVRSGVREGLTRLLSELGGTDEPGMSITPLGGNRFRVTADLDLDGNGSRETPITLDADFAGDPTDGLEDTDLPVDVDLDQQSTPAGTVSLSSEVTVLGTLAFLVQGDSTTLRGNLTEESEFGWSVELIFPNIPIHGFESIESRRGESRASYEVTYRSGADGRQYILVEGTIDGIPFSFDLGVPPEPE